MLRLDPATPDGPARTEKVQRRPERRPIGRRGHAGVPRGRNEEAAIMADERPERGRHCLDG
jgi:hypothetical protein